MLTQLIDRTELTELDIRETYILADQTNKHTQGQRVNKLNG